MSLPSKEKILEKAYTSGARAGGKNGAKIGVDAASAVITSGTILPVLVSTGGAATIAATTGAALGSVIPVAGTIIGTGIGITMYTLFRREKR